VDTIIGPVIVTLPVIQMLWTQNLKFLIILVNIMVTITLNSEVAEKLERLRREGETLNDVIKRIVETYEELMDYIDEKWEKLQRDKEKFIDLEDYASSRGL